MTTPKQERKTIETPFGTAVINDWRNSNVVNETRASLSFDRFVANRKDYGSITLYLEAPVRAWNPAPFLTTVTYRTLTEAARRAVRDYFVPSGKIIADLAPYIEELDADDARADLKARIQHKALQGLDKAVSYAADRSDAKTSDLELAAELLDEILADVARQRQSGKSYADIYLKS